MQNFHPHLVVLATKAKYKDQRRLFSLLEYYREHEAGGDSDKQHSPESYAMNVPPKTTDQAPR